MGVSGGVFANRTHIRNLAFLLLWSIGFGGGVGAGREARVILGKTILVVHEDAGVRRPLESMLREEGYAAIAASGAEACLRRVEEVLPDLIVLDPRTVGSDGFRVSEALKRDPRWSHVPIVPLAAGEDGAASRYSASDVLRRVRELLAENGSPEKKSKGVPCPR